MDFISLISQKILSHTGIIVNSIQYDLIKDFEAALEYVNEHYSR